VRHFNARRFLQALLVALPVLALGITGMFFSFALLRPVSVNNLAFLIVRLPLVFALLISLWIVAPSGARADSKSLPAQNAPRA
jgi:hypothetical protein